MSADIEIQLIAMVVAVACSLPGVFLVLRKMAMMSDAITHTILLGIVIAFFITLDLSSPLLIIGAAAMGLITVVLTELLYKTGLVSEDSSIGVVFPLLFSIAIIIISKYAGSAHLDTDAVLLGELAFVRYNRLVLFGIDLGPKALFTMGTILVANITLIIVFFKELKIATFDPALAQVLGFLPVVIHYGLMAMVSITAVGAFESVGSILVIAFMIGPPVTAYLLTDDLKKMILISAGFASLNAVLGYQIAKLFDVSISGSMAVITGLTFVLVFVFAPKRGLITTLKRRKKQRILFACHSLLFHLLNHEGESDEVIESGQKTIKDHLNWSDEFLGRILESTKKENWVYLENNLIKLTEDGREYAKETMESLLGEL